MLKKKIVLVVGARPNFMKSAPLMRELSRHGDRFETLLIHTGQHYDHKLSQLFFDELRMPKPDIYLGVGSGSHAEQTARIMTSLENELTELKPDLVIVFGDVNSTLATSIVTSKLWIKLGHVEAGLRSFDNTMPEEINRIVTDRLSDFLFVSEPSGLANLKAEGVPDEKVFYTGNIMIDSLVSNLEVANKSDILKRLGLKRKEYIAMTMHRPANVDNPDILKSIIASIQKIGERLPIVFPCHPRTRNRIEEFGLLQSSQSAGLRIIEPLGYLDFLKLQADSRLVLTDSGGIQEETTYLQIPCITMRENTERPATVDIGTNIIAGTDPQKITESALVALDGTGKKGAVPELWDGKTAGRIVEILLRKLF